MENNKDLFEVLLANNYVPPGAEFQVPCVAHVVLVGQLKSHGVKVGRRNNSVIVLLLLGVQKTYEVCPCSASAAPAPTDPYDAYVCFAAFTAFQQLQVYQQQVQATQAAASAHPPQVGNNMPLELFIRLQLSLGLSH